jgi:hypothetical protein
MPTLEPHLYIDLGSDYVGWKDITSDVLIDNAVRWTQGITSNDQRDRLANTGQFMIELDNSSDNSGGMAGYYSPGHSDCLPGFEIGRRIRWQYETQAGQDPAFIISTDKPASDAFNSDTQIIYTSVAKTDNSFQDGLYYPVFTSDGSAVHDTDKSTIVQGLDLNNHTIAYWVKLTASTDPEMPEFQMIVSTTDSTRAVTERIFTTITATDATYYPSVVRTFSDNVSAWNQTVVNSDYTITSDWYHVAATFCASDAVMTMYVNGVAIKADMGSDVIVPTTDTYKQFYVKLGVNDGSMGHVAVWNRALTSDEIFGLYQLGEFSFDGVIGIAHEAPLIYYTMGAKASHGAAVHAEQNRAISYTWAQLMAGYKPALPRYEFNGRISNIEVAVGKFGDRKTIIEAVDWLDDAANVFVANVPTMVGYTADDVLYNMILYSGVTPTMFDLDVGQTLSYSWGSSKGNETLYSELKRLVQSEPGYIYMRAGAGSDGEVGGILDFESKSARFQKTTTDAAFGDVVNSDAPYEINVSRTIDKLINSVEVTVHPVEIDTVAVPLYTLSSDQAPAIPAYGELTLTVKYTDTDEAYELIGAAEVVQPVRNVDYTINTRADGLGDDKTDDIRSTISTTQAGNLLAYYLGYEQNGFIMANYKKPSTHAATSNPISSGGITAVNISSGGGSTQRRQWIQT